MGLKRYVQVAIAVLVAILQPGSNLTRGRPAAGTAAGRKATGEEF